MTVFDFTVCFRGDTELQHRYVVARDEEEAFRKLAEHAEELKRSGCAEMYPTNYPTVALDYVIC